MAAALLTALLTGGAAAQDLVVSESIAGATFRFAAEDDAAERDQVERMAAMR